jgi:hypothetical protein
MIDYARMQKAGPRLKRQLTIAKNTADASLRFHRVKLACEIAVSEWEQVGAWPDNWSLWQRTLDDAASEHNRAAAGREWVIAPRLEEL